ncbi:MAG: hypothetical protein ACI9EF_002919 [Pseudohongiellaceae bacterium]
MAQVAGVYDRTGGDIKAMLRVVLGPDAFAGFKPWVNPKLKRPEHFVAGLFQALGATVELPVTDWT